jgi:hypothetical protein
MIAVHQKYDAHCGRYDRHDDDDVCVSFSSGVVGHTTNDTRKKSDDKRQTTQAKRDDDDGTMVSVPMAVVPVPSTCYGTNGTWYAELAREKVNSESSLWAPEI